MTEIKPIPITTLDRKDFLVRGSWEARAETPEELAVRFLRMIDSLKQIGPIFSHWTCGWNDRETSFELVRDRFSQKIAADISTDDWGEPMLIDGYWFGAYTRDQPSGRNFAIRCHAGSAVNAVLPNKIVFKTSSFMKAVPDPDVVTYRIFRSALLAIADAWDPVELGAYSGMLIQMNPDSSHIFLKAWIQYLCPWLAQKITPPTTALVERLPGGGLLMNATTDTFDVNNQKHMAVAEDMAAAMAPLDRLPWPSRP
jgi:Immunity protein 52